VCTREKLATPMRRLVDNSLARLIAHNLRYCYMPSNGSWGFALMIFNSCSLFWIAQRRFYGPHQRWASLSALIRPSIWRSIFRARGKGVNGDMKGEGRLLGGCQSFHLTLINKKPPVSSSSFVYRSFIHQLTIIV
jgi:hypothetical protein